MNTKQLITYRGLQHQRLFDDMTLLFGRDENVCDGTMPDSFPCASQLTELTAVYGFEGNLWHCFLALYMANHENAYSIACKIRGAADGTLNNLVLQDFRILKQIFDYDITTSDRLIDSSELWNYLAAYKAADGGVGKVFNKRAHDRIIELSLSLAKAEDAEEFQDTTTEFYKESGVGKSGLNKAFRIAEEKGKVCIEPIANVEHVYPDDIIDYELQKQKLTASTESFIQGKAADNVLLFGDAGTGKSSSIKTILNEYYNRDLCITEIYKHQFYALSSVLEQARDRNYRLIIYMDDLSFEESELEYKHLKVITEGGLGRKSKSVLIHATFNRRHSIREKFNDEREPDDELHVNDTVQKKLSLVARFDVTIYSGAPDKKKFQNVVKLLAEKYHVEMPVEELYTEASKWELNHGGLSGRTVVQFIIHLLGLPENYG